MIDRRSLLAAGAAAAGALALPAARAQAYPDRAIKVVVPWPAGGNADVTIRPVLDRMAQILGQPIVAENRAGATGNVGSAQAARATPDGYSLLQLSSSTILNSALSPDKTYDLQRDFEPIGLVASTPMVLEVHPSVPARTLAEFIAHAKANPGKLTYASGGIGTTAHLLSELLNLRAGLDMTHIPYQGGAPAVADLIGGHVGFSFASMPSALPHVRAGKLRALAVAPAQRVPSAPELPTVAESGLPGFSSEDWQGVLAPAKTPQDIVMRLNGEIHKVLGATEVRDKLDAQGFQVRLSTPQQFAELIRSESTKWAKIVKEANIRID